MNHSGRQDAAAIWQAAVDAVDSERLVRQSLTVDGDTLRIKDRQISLKNVGHIEVVGAGKAGAGMARGIERILAALPPDISWSGWINVPDDCVQSLDRIVLHGARPAGVNEPTQAGVDGTHEILHRVSRLKANDLCLTLLSGGGSALLPAPVPGVSLDDKLAVTRLLASSGASIQELNVVRSRISAVKAGGLARACSAARLLTLIISDVIGDPLDIIASGPTCAPRRTAFVDPLEVLQKFDPDLRATPPSVSQVLRRPVEAGVPDCRVENCIIGNNEMALEAAASAAKKLHYEVASWGSDNAGMAADLGRRLIIGLERMRQDIGNSGQPRCLLAGGETTVQLCDPSTRGTGGRNQEVVLSAIAERTRSHCWRGLTLLSGGTDGEDGPTPSAGAVADEALVAEAERLGLCPREYLRTNNAWPFFDRLKGLLNTGPTHTNVMDVQVGLVCPLSTSAAR